MVLWVECSTEGRVWCCGLSVVLWVECDVSSDAISRNINFIASAMESG